MPDGSPPPSADQLRDRIVREFLREPAEQYSLQWAADLAISATDLSTIQDFIAAQFRAMRPASFHGLIPTFRWRGIATTNYDRLVETVYQSASKPVQRPASFLSDDDRVDDRIRQDCLILLKLHGCISRTNDPRLPLILSTDQYVTYRENRNRLFNMLEEWGHENTIVFVGHRLQDPNLRAILQSLTTRVTSRPRYYLVRPSVDQVESDFWASKQITVLNTTFKEFLEAADSAIDPRMRSLAAELPDGHPIETRFVQRTTASPVVTEFLTTYAEYVHEGITYKAADPKLFYRGVALGWYPIVEGLDVRRKIVDRFLEDVVLQPEEDRSSTVELYLIKAEAGAGKSVLIHRLAWDSAIQAGVLCLRSIRGELDNLDALRELHDLTDERIFLFVDDASEHVHGLVRAIEYSRQRGLRVTFVTAERLNEWNVYCEPLDEYLSESFTVRYLSETEVGTLVDLLEKHDAIGPNLRTKTRQERVEEFVKRAGRQLLVALHEATRGIPFEEILLDEYRNLTPPEAQQLYLSVCVLNSFGVPVRAGVISRIHNIPFGEFRKRLFRPLEHVVLTSELPWGDYAYSARHTEIARIVFNRVLTTPEDRFNECVRLIKALIPTYDVDRTALRGLIRGKTLLDLFPNDSDVKALYAAAEQVLGDDPYLLQQRANYERLRPRGDLRLAQSLLERAKLSDPRDLSIVHTLAEVLRARCEFAEQPKERLRLRRDAKATLRSIRRESKYATVTELKIVVDEVRDMLTSGNTGEQVLNEAIRNADRAFQLARQTHAGDSYILTTEADFANLLAKHDRALDVLRQARSANPRDPFVSSRVAVLLSKRGEFEEARACLAEALEGNPNDTRINHQYAELLRVSGMANAEELAYFYRKSFVNGDNNYESQFWFARFAYESKDADDVSLSREIFRKLRQVPMKHDARIRVRDAIGGMTSPQVFAGHVARLESAHGFIAADGRWDWVFLHTSDIDRQLWDELGSGDRVTFSVGFNFRGPKALDVDRE